MLPVGSRVGDYEIEADLGEGGMARVYRARHVFLDTHHALKVLDPELRANAEARQRFLDEARIQAKHLDHPGIVKVTNIVATPEHAALVMELVDGGSLEDEVGALRARPDEIKRIMRGVLDAVGHAHAAGIVHRDLKPANVLIAGAARTPKVTDFGIAKVSADAGRARKKSTHAATRMGTLSYMSPEQIRRAKDVTARSDIFSLGAMLYELATGALPFDAESDYDVMEQIVNGRYVPPEQREPRIDPVIAATIRRALQPDPAARFGSCAEMAAALDAPSRDSGGDTTRRAGDGSGRPEPVTPRSRAPLVVGAVLGLAVIGTGVAVHLSRAGAAAPPDAITWTLRDPDDVVVDGGVAAGDGGERASSFIPAPTEGPNDAPVTIVIGANFVDPNAARTARALTELRRRYPVDVRLVHRAFFSPITKSFAEPVQRAACAAHRQGRYHAYADLLWMHVSGRGSVDDDRLIELAEQLGMDRARFEKDFGGAYCALDVGADQLYFEDLGLQRTPVYIVNGRVLEGAQTVETLSAAVEAARAGRDAVPQGMVLRPDGLGIESVQGGLGEQPGMVATVVVHYTIWLWERGAKGRKLDSSYDRGAPATWNLNGQIAGIAMGVSTMRRGAIRRLLIPPGLGYGTRGGKGIPPDATLLVEVELREVR